MAQYKGKPVKVEKTPAEIAEKFADLSVLGNYLDNIPAEERQKIGDIRFETDAIVMKNPAVGEMAFKVIERTDRKIVFHADGIVPVELEVNLEGIDNGSATNVTTAIDIDIPAMMRPLVGGKLQQAADMFGSMIGKLASLN